MNPFAMGRANRAPLALFAVAVPWLSSTVHAEETAHIRSDDRVVITANRLPQAASSVLADISILEPEEIARLGASSVADVLATLPGVEVSRNGGPGSSTSVFIRGSDSRHVAVYVDGVRVDSQSSGGAVWEQIPIDQIERIEVLRGPAAAVYGSDAVAGVVQLFTRRGQRGALHTHASLSVGTANTVQMHAGISGVNEGVDYALSLGSGRSGGWDARTSQAAGHNPDADGWSRRSAQGRLGLQISPVHRVEVSLVGSQLRSGFDNAFSPAGQDDQNHHLMRAGRVLWQGRWSESATTRLQVGESRSHYETQPNFYRTETVLRDVTLQHEQRLDGMGVLGLTLERRGDALENAATAYGAGWGGKRHQDALGGTWLVHVGEHRLQAQARYDRDSEFGGHGTGSLAWGWDFAPEWRTTASVATALRVPTLYQRFSAYGNSELVPESARNVEVGLKWADGARDVSLTVWRNTVSQLIDWLPQSGNCASVVQDPTWGGCYANVGRARLQGATLAGGAEWEGVRLRGSLDWHDPRNLSTGLVLARRAKRMATVSADVAVLAGLRVGGEVQAVGVRFDDAANAKRMGGYATLALWASYALAPGLEVSARIDNAGGKRYELAQSYATAGRSAQMMLRWASF